ncbi:MAG: beta-Ala-His dipeptidase, partial [Bacteroidales bacterium]|nr:beta-Ala-His dipeptidase [Bacteroidales bacterium]
MDKDILKLYPERMWYYFAEILRIPRPSKKEELILQYLKDFGTKLQLETIQDETGNLLIRKPATEGMEIKKSVVLQSHVDMVGEKNADKIHDFEKDPITSYIEDGWVKAAGTTLGADCGIGIAAQLAILESKDIVHGPIECLFTVDEETGLTGAFGLKPDLLNGEILLNLDSEDEGELFIGCAGGIDTVGRLPFNTTLLPKNLFQTRVIIKGLIGGHSGDDIHKGRGNAVKLMNRFLWNANHRFSILVSEFSGGNLRNAIAREAQAIISCEVDKKDKLLAYVKEIAEVFKSEYRITEPDLEFEALAIKEKIETAIDVNFQEKLLNVIYTCPHGVHAWSADIPNFVETSTNLASVKIENGNFLITTSQRSSVETAKHDIKDMVASSLYLAGAEVSHS